MNKTITKVISAFSACIFLLFLLALLNRSGSLILFWQERPIGKITHDEGYGYYAYMPDENISRLKLPVYLKEDENYPVQGIRSVNEDITATIKERGGGRYVTQTNNDIYFSASDNDPEEHEYSIISPIIIQTRYLLGMAVLSALIGAAQLILCRKNKDYKILQNQILWLTGFFLLLLLLPWNKMIFPNDPVPVKGIYFKPLFQRNPVCFALFFILLLLTAKKIDQHKNFRLAVICIIAWNSFCYFIPEWDLYGQRADSYAYLQHYDASSIRTPGYPVFIEAVYKISGNNGLKELRTENSFQDEALLDQKSVDSKGLINVTRAQKCILGLSFLLFICICSRYYSPSWLAFGAELILCCGLLGVDNSYIMTECLSQAAVILCAVLLILTVKEKNTLPFLILCVLSGIAILIRPANIFLLIPLLIAALITFRRIHSIILPAIGCFLFVLISAIPAVTIFRQYGIFVWMPTSGYVEIARAVELMKPGDEKAFDDAELRDFCLDLMELKEQYPDADQNTNMWQVGIAAAQKRGYDTITCSPLFGKISRKIFQLHFDEFTASIVENIKTALERTRLSLGPITFLYLLGLFTILFLIRITTDSLTGMVLVLMHTAHLCISMTNQPERRYIYSTEILCLLGWLLIWISLLSQYRHRTD